jgi:hypothetical protein
MKDVCVFVEPGICGFSCRVEARQENKHQASIKITGSQCKQIRKLAENITEVTLQDLFARHTANPVIKAAEQAGCHLTCPVPVAVLKAAEAVLDLALPRDVCITFKQHHKKETT